MHYLFVKVLDEWTNSLMTHMRLKILLRIVGLLCWFRMHNIKCKGEKQGLYIAEFFMSYLFYLRKSVFWMFCIICKKLSFSIQGFASTSWRTLMEKKKKKQQLLNVSVNEKFKCYAKCGITQKLCASLSAFLVSVCKWFGFFFLGTWNVLINFKRLL